MSAVRLSTLPLQAAAAILCLLPAASLNALALTSRDMHYAVCRWRWRMVRISTFTALQSVLRVFRELPYVGLFVRSLRVVDVRTSFFEADALDCAWLALLLRSCPELEELHLSGIDFLTSECVDAYAVLVASLPPSAIVATSKGGDIKRGGAYHANGHLAALTVAQCRNLPGHALRRFLAALNVSTLHLESLCLSRLAATSVDDFHHCLLAVSPLGDSPLKRLDVSHNSALVSDASLNFIGQLFPTLTSLSVGGNLGISTPTLGTLTTLLPVTSLDISGCIQWTPEHLVQILAGNATMLPSPLPPAHEDDTAPPYSVVDGPRLPLQKFAALNIAQCDRIRVTAPGSLPADMLANCHALNELTIHYGTPSPGGRGDSFSRSSSSTSLFPLSSGSADLLPAYPSSSSAAAAGAAGPDSLQVSLAVLASLPLLRHLVVRDLGDGVSLATAHAITAACPGLVQLTVQTRLRLSSHFADVHANVTAYSAHLFNAHHRCRLVVEQLSATSDW
ncbi:hypothetical protein RI367_004094 [Sorochytrium milnesiophthora]